MPESASLHKRKVMNIDLGSEKGYLIAAGVRGPDEYIAASFGPSLKTLFSARLRFMCHVNYDGAETRSSKYTAFDIEEFLALARENPDCRGVLHYLSHMNRAFGALREDEIYGEEACLLLILAEHLYYCFVDPLDRGCKVRAQKIIRKLNKREAESP